MFLDKLNFLMREKKINKHILAMESGIPYTTIDSFYKKGYENTKLSTLIKLCEYFNVSLDYLMKDDDYSNSVNSETLYNNDGEKLTSTETQLIENYRSLNEDGREKIFDYVEDLITSGRYIKIDSDEMVDKKNA